MRAPAIRIANPARNQPKSNDHFISIIVADFFTCVFDYFLVELFELGI